jgi:hypothetical protein
MRRRARPSDLVTASEVASWVYCSEQWRLEHGLGLDAENRTVLDAGARHHARKALAERIAGWALRFGQLVMVIGMLLLLLWVLWR